MYLKKIIKTTRFFFFENLHVSIIKCLSLRKKKLQFNHFECTVAKEKYGFILLNLYPETTVVQQSTAQSVRVI